MVTVFTFSVAFFIFRCCCPTSSAYAFTYGTTSFKGISPVPIISSRSIQTKINVSKSSFVQRDLERSRRNITTIKHRPGKDRKASLSMLRNVDLPEALIFYGLDTVINVDKSSSSQPQHTVRPGVLRLIEEAKSQDIPSIILSEHMLMDELSKALETICPNFHKLKDENALHYRSSLEEFVVEEDSKMSEDEADVYVPYRFVGRGVGHAPCPAALYDAVNTLTIDPKGFGGSSGFGVKNWESARIPFAQHCVVFVSSASDYDQGGNRSGGGRGLDRSDGSGSISRDRCVAARTAGMRVIYIEDELGTCTAEDVSDGVVETLGTEDDWEMVTIDDVSTPGSFWLNMMQPKDENGVRVDTEDVIAGYMSRRIAAVEE